MPVPPASSGNPRNRKHMACCFAGGVGPPRLAAPLGFGQNAVSAAREPAIAYHLVEGARLLRLHFDARFAVRLVTPRASAGACASLALACRELLDCGHPDRPDPPASCSVAPHAHLETACGASEPQNSPA